MATAGIVRPMLASAEPSARLRLVCSRSARAARSAAQVSGASTSMAMTMPTTVGGRPADAMPCSIVGESVLARPITASSATTSRPKLAQAMPAEGGAACADSSSARSGGRK